MSVDEWRDFVAYQLNDDGAEEELTSLDLQNIKQELTSERVLLLCRYDLRKIYIWKGPRSPVRKRFISSRVASRLQEKATNTRGMHLKIISVDAGDEPADFLSSFNLERYEIKDEEKPEDLYYVTNAEKQKMAELGTQKQNQQATQQKQEYWSPLLEEEKKGGAAPSAKAVDLSEEKKKAIQKMKEMTQSEPVIRPVQKPTYAPAPAMGSQDVEKILKDVTEKEAPKEFKRLNIIVGANLFGPSIIKQQVFGKEIEKQKWDLIQSVPEGRIEIDSKKIVIHAKDNKILAVEILMDLDGKVHESIADPKKEELKADSGKCEAKVDSNDSSPNTAQKPGKRSLPPIPKAEE